MKIRFIDPKVHALLDYSVAGLLVVAPFVPGLLGGSVAALWISLAAGVGLLCYSLLTAYSAGARKAISYRLHLGLDAAAAVGLLAMPVIFGFGGAARAFFWVVGAAVIAVVATSKLEQEPALSPAANDADAA